MAELLVWPILAADWQTAAVLPRLAEQQPDSGWLNNQTESGWLEILVVVIADNNLPVIQISILVVVSGLTAAVSFCQGWQSSSLTVAG